MYSKFVTGNHLSSFRYVKTEELEEMSKQIMAKGATSGTNQEFLVPEPTLRKWRTKVSNDSISKESLVKDAIRPSRIDSHSKTRDLDTLKTFLSVNKRDALCLPSTVKLNDAIPVGAPILDFLAVESKSTTNKHKYPSEDEIKIYQMNRGCDYKSIFPIDPEAEVCVKEVFIGFNSRDEILSKFSWLKEKVKEDNQIFPHGTISFSMKDVKITENDLKDVLMEREVPDHPVFSTPRNKMEAGDTLVRLPTMIFLGTGLRFALIIIWPCGKQEDGSYMILSPQHLDDIIDQMNDLPPLVGVGLQNDVKVVQDIFTAASHGKRCLKMDWIPIEGLALLCGYRLQATNVSALALNILGGLMDKMSSAGDGEWCSLWQSLPSEFQIYALKDLQFSSICYNVLAAVFLRDIAPDPDTWCEMTGLNDQFDVVSQILSWVKHSLSKTEIWWNPSSSNVTTREHLMKCIRTRLPTNLSTERKPKFSPPLERVMIWSDILGNWPPITGGGPGRTHDVQKHARYQARVLSMATDEVLPGIGSFRKNLEKFSSRPSANHTLPSASIDSTQVLVVEDSLDNQDVEEEIMIIGNEAGRNVVEYDEIEDSQTMRGVSSRPPTPFPFMYTQAQQSQHGATTKRNTASPLDSTESNGKRKLKSSKETATAVDSRSSGKSSSSSSSSSEGSSSSDDSSSSEDSDASDISLEALETLCKVVQRKLDRVKKKKEDRSKTPKKSARKDKDFLKYLDDYERDLK